MLPTAIRRLLSGFVRLAWPLMALAGSAPAIAAVDLADQPLFSTVSVPGNLVLTLSVEWPTANTPAYFSTTAYASSSTFQGYFDPDKCYQYNYNSTTPSSSYFAPYGTASSHTCSGSSSLLLWSGNYLNWASMQSLDIFRWVLTGGNRTVDTATSTILQKTYHSGQDGGGSAVNKSVSDTTLVSGATPFNYALNSRIWGAGIRLLLTGTASLSGTANTLTIVDWNGQNSYVRSGGSQANASTIYAVYINVKVCDSTVGLESDCVRYGSNYKPEGLMQQYSTKLRYSAFGYLNDGNGLRDGGVMRGRMKYVGPLQPVPGSASITNSNAEWDASTGVMSADPDHADSTATTANTTAAGYTVTISQSGVMNYLNKFGYSAKTYKTYDPVSEMYYAAIRYLKNLGNVPSYSSLSGAGSTATMSNWLDGFPVIPTWSDPILYSCQKNFILGIGDVNTWKDANLPGSSLVNSNEPTTPAEVTADTTVNVSTATNMVGQLEGISNLATTYVSSGRTDTYYAAGLAYDSHTVDIRSDLAGMQTVSTYWLDVQENQTYVNNNVYYLATKYGGFTVPAGFQPYAASNGTGTLPLTSWHNNTDLLGNGTNKRPDNYFTANNADAMKSGLTNAFARISAEAAAADSTAFSAPTPNVTSTGSSSYAASYDPSTWTGNVIGSSVTFDASGAPTLTTRWDARSLLSASTVTASTRKIVTCCLSNGGPGLAFTWSALSTSGLNSRTNYASFNNVPGVSSTAQSGSNYVSYLRGDTSQEIANGGAYRTRTYRLGDIVNSKPVAVGVPQFVYYDATNPGYSSFKTSYASRNTVVYVGSNDGMLHAFDGSVGNSTSGSELFAYVPSFVYGSSSTASTSGLASLGNPSFTHHYLVDATPVTGDVNFNRTSGATGSTADWRTILVGGLGKGGNGYYALDVTNPASWTSEAAVAGKVLWEFTDSHMGYSFGPATIVKTKKYGWVVVVTSGYNDSDGVGYFFFVNPRTGALLETVATPSGSTSAPIDLGPASAFIPDYTDGTADALYAGDMQGNLWRLDVTPTSGSYSAPTAIATLRNASSQLQPVTTRALPEIDPSSNKRYVLVGTGRLLADSDIASANVQTFYAIVDGTGSFGGFYTSATLPSGVTFPITRSALNADTDLVAGIGSAPASAMGWYFDLPVSSSIAQRVNVDPFATQGVVSFAGNQPNGQVCSPAGTGTIYTVAFGTGKSLLTDHTTGATVASIADTAGVITDVEIMNVAGSLKVIVGDSTSAVTNPPANLSSLAGVKQLNWRDIPTGN